MKDNNQKTPLKCYTNSTHIKDLQILLSHIKIKHFQNINN
jgi:hypothetical protein